MAQNKSKPAKITVILEDGAQDVHDLSGDKDWAVIFEDVLEVKSRDGVHYYPFASILKWTIKPEPARSALGRPEQSRPEQARPE